VVVMCDVALEFPDGARFTGLEALAPPAGAVGLIATNSTTPPIGRGSVGPRPTDLPGLPPSSKSVRENDSLGSGVQDREGRAARSRRRLACARRACRRDACSYTAQRHPSCLPASPAACQPTIVSPATRLFRVESGQLLTRACYLPPYGSENRFRRS
jgi:hypothetical protein